MSLPTKISRYQLTEELGRGGMGVVYRAEDPELGRAVAIKLILFPPRADEETRQHLEQRFAREARAAAAIRHTGVITVFDFGRDGDYLFLVMELIEGQSLADRLVAGGPPGRIEAYEIVAKVADGLAAAHAAGVVHRDVTPRNILLAMDGRVLVTDFGLARSLGEETHELTHSGTLVGSPRYMAPELVRGQPFDGRADLFSLGVILYLLLSGKPAFQATDITALLYQIVHEDPLDDPELRAELPPEAVRCLDRCLAKSPGDRFATAADLASEARRLRARAEGLAMAETATLAVPGELAGEPRTPAAWRKHGVFGGLGLLLLALAGVAIWTLVPATRSTTADREAKSSGSAHQQAAITEPAAVDPDLSAGEAKAGSVPLGTEPALATEATAESRDVAEPAASAPLDADPLAENANPPAASPEVPAHAVLAELEGSRTAGSSGPLLRANTVAQADEMVAESPPEPTSTDSGPTPPDADGVAPVLSIDALPADLSAATEVALSGRVLDDRGAVALSIDGESVAVGAGGEFRVVRPLEPGRNAWTLIAVDGAGNQTARSLEMIVAEGSGEETPEPDRRPPGRGAKALRFADRGDGTLVDRLTGMMWTKRTGPVEVPWKEGRSYCRDLELGRQADWIQPTIEELEEFYRGGGNDSPEGVSGGLRFPAVRVWSAKKSRSAAWVFDFATGQRVELALRSDPAPRALALCLRRSPGPGLHEGRRPEDPSVPVGGPQAGERGGGQRGGDPRGNGPGGNGPGGNGPGGNGPGGNGPGGNGPGGNGRGGNGPSGNGPGG